MPHPQYDLFISYARADNHEGRVTQLVDRIRADFPRYANRPLTAFFDHHSIQGMEDWRQSIYQGLRESRLFLACLSPAYIASDNCEWEFVEYQKREIASAHGVAGVAPIYFVQVPGWDDKDFDQRCKEWVTDLRRRQRFDLRPWSAEGEAALHDQAVRERMAALNQRLAETIRQGELAESSLGNVDAHNPHFQGRQASLRQLRDNFVKPETIGVLTAVNGVGGLGKTALAIEYAHAYAHEYGGGRWQVRCAGQQSLGLALAQLATPIGFEFTDDEKMSADLMLDRVRAELHKLAQANQPPRCLLLLDNVDRPELLSPAAVQRLNCGDWLHVLATTRLGENELSGRSPDRRFLAIDELPPADALALIEEYQPNGAFPSESERQAARDLVALLGGFTLAVEAAAVYLGKYAGEVTCAGFLALLKRKGLDALDRQAAASGEQVRHGEISLSATLQPTLERLTPPQRLALEFAALLPPDQVALPWLRALVAQTFPEIAQDAEPGLPDPWRSLLRGLFSQRLLQATDAVDDQGQPRIARVHRLLQQLVLSDRPEPARAAHEQAIDALIRERDAALKKTTVWEPARWELEPLTALASLWDETNHPRAAWLLNQAGLRWHNLAAWGQAEPLMRRALTIDEQSHGPNHPEVATDLNNLAGLLQATNRLAEAEPMYRRALAIDERSYGPNHPDVAIDLSNLAQLLQDTNRLPEAEPLMRRALEIATNFTRATGHRHPSLQGRTDRYRSLLRSMGRTEDQIQATLHEMAPDLFH